MIYCRKNLNNVISIEGLEGSGKTTIAKMIEASGITIHNNLHKVVYSREPGGVEVSEKIRDIVVNNEMNSITELLLYAASRSEHFFKKIEPFVDNNLNNDIMILDRFIDSSFAIQGNARGLGIQTVYDANMIALEGHLPELTIFLDVDPEVGLERARTVNPNKFEKYDVDFHEKVRDGFLKIPKYFNNRNFYIISTMNKSIEEVFSECINLIQKYYEDKCSE